MRDGGCRELFMLRLMWSSSRGQAQSDEVQRTFGSRCMSALLSIQGGQCNFQMYISVLWHGYRCKR